MHRSPKAVDFHRGVLEILSLEGSMARHPSRRENLRENENNIVAKRLSLGLESSRPIRCMAHTVPVEMRQDTVSFFVA